MMNGIIALYIRLSLEDEKHDYLLRGKVFCGCCDHDMNLRNGRKQDFCAVAPKA